MWQGSWINHWTLTSSFCSMSRLAGWFLLKKCGLYCESCGFRYHRLLNVKYNKCPLLEILLGDIKGKSAFQTIVTNRNYFSRLLISSLRVSMAAKTDDEVYVSSTIKIYSYFSFIFSAVPKKVQLLKISKVMWLLWKLLPPWKIGRQEHNKFFGQFLLHPAVF